MRARYAIGDTAQPAFRTDAQPDRKLVVFAHTPPPHHGQSYMVEQLVKGLGGDARANRTFPAPGTDLLCYHVNCRYSLTVQAIGRVSPKKILLALHYCAQAIWCRFRYGVKSLLYVPAPPLRSAVYRDWIVMAVCRPFFSTRIFYWQAAGISDWLSSEAKAWERRITRALLGQPTLSIVLAESNRRDANELGSKRVEVIPNFIPDPCPGFDRDVRPLRSARQAARRKIAAGEPLTNPSTIEAGEDPRLFRILFLGLCSRSKGLFDAIEAVALAQGELVRRRSGLGVRLEVAGAFWHAQERQEFEQRIRQVDMLISEAGAGPDGVRAPSGSRSLVRYHGFVSGGQKQKLLLESDCLCFPTYYPAESFGLVLLEAMAYGLPIIATQWRMIPEILPAGYPGMVEPQSPLQMASLILTFMVAPPKLDLRAHFLNHYTDKLCIDRIRSVLGNRFTSVEKEEATIPNLK